MMDIMYYRLKKEGRFYLVSILDDYSRFIVAHKVCTTQTGDKARKAIDDYVEHYNYERVHMGIDYLIPADRFLNTAKAVEETVEQASSEKMSFYLIGKLDGQPVRLLMNKTGTVTVYLAGQAVKELRSTAELKELLL